MVEDARFEDGGETPLTLRALDPGDLEIVSALVQDSVVPATEFRFDRKSRRFAVLLNRFRWEDAENARRGRRSFERVQSVLLVEDVMAVRSQGISKADPDVVLSLLSLSFEPSSDGAGRVLMTFAGDGAIALDVEALEVVLKDVTKPYAAVSGRAPRHED